jgi:hypothetical protein
MMDRIAWRFPSVVVLDPKSAFCPSEHCITSDNDGLYFRDVGHLTNAGSDFLVSSMRTQLVAALASLGATK